MMILTEAGRRAPSPPARRELPPAPIAVADAVRPRSLPLARHEVPREHAPLIEPPLRRRLLFLDAVVVLSAWLGAAALTRTTSPGPVLPVLLAEAVAAVGLTIVALNALRLYRARVCVVRRVARRRHLLAAAVAPLVVYVRDQLTGIDNSAGRLAVTAALIALGLVVGREAFEQWLLSSRVRGRYFRPVVVVGTLDEVERVVSLLVDHPETGCEVMGWLGEQERPSTVPAMATVPCLGSVANAREIVRRAEVGSVMVAPSVASSGQFHELVAMLQASGTHVQLWTGLRSIDTRRLRAAPMANEPFFYLEPAGAASGKRWVKRALDVTLSLAVLVLASPVLALVAVAIKLHDGGPVFFRQVRVGHRGRTFELHKFRTMTVDAERRLGELQAQNERSGPLFKVAHDPRVTPVGRILRATSLDELPQLVDVLVGHLSLVGPRPALPAEVAEFDDELLQRHDVVPGVTGLWQVEARHNPSFDVYRRLDLFYVQNWTLTLDIVLLLATVKTVVTDAIHEVSGAVGRRLRRDVRATTSPARPEDRGAKARRKAPRPARPGREHIGIIVQNLPVPLDRRVWNECGALVAAGYRVSVICPKGPGDPSYQELDGVRIHKYAPPPARDGYVAFAFEVVWCWLRTAWLARRIHREERFDAIQACNPPDTFWALAALFKVVGVRFVFDHHDLCPEIFRARFGRDDGLALRVLLGLERATFALADHVISTNESYREVALTRGRRRWDETTVVRSGPDPERLRPVAPDPALTRGHRYLCCYLGIMGHQDGVDVVLRAADLIINTWGRTDVGFALLGFGDCFDELQRLAVDLGLTDHVEFTGRVELDDIRRYLSSGDIGLSPDPRSPFNEASTMNKTMEYMACGLPVVAFDLHETRVSAGSAAIYAPDDEVSSFAKAIVSLLDDAEARAAMGTRGRRAVETHLGWPTQAPRYVGVYDRLFARDRGPDIDLRDRDRDRDGDRDQDRAADLDRDRVLAGFRS